MRNLVGRAARIAASAVLAAVASSVAFAAPSPGSAVQKPNILYIMADDVGWRDVGFRNPEVRTPELDRLAASGVKLEQFYAQPMCTPTRAALMTGRYPFRYGLQTAVIPAGYDYGLPLDEYLLPQVLADAGYATAIVGKWHIGHGDRKMWPGQRGFQHAYGPLIGEIDYFTHEAEGVVDWYRGDEKVIEPGYSTELLGDDAVRLIRAHDPSRPLFLYLAFNAAHTPYQAPQKYLDLYPNVADPSRKAYLGSISAMDDQVARVVRALGERGMLANTLIVFQSDNGGTHNPMFAGAIADVSKIKIPCDNGPYRDGKGSLYEGGTRVVAFATWPGHLPQGATSNEILHVVDMYPTLARLGGGVTTKQKPLDGTDVWVTLAGGQPSPRTEVVYNIEPMRAGVRQGNWKLVWKAILPATSELYDIASDPSERHDVAAQHPEIVAALQKRANELAAAGVQPTLLQIEFQGIVARSHLPPAFPGEELQLNREH